MQLESNGYGVSLGRFSHYLYRFYRGDVDEGNLTREEALELIEFFWIKFNELTNLTPWPITRWFGGYPMYQTVTLGGQSEDGGDDTNELTYLDLEILQA